MQPFGALPVMPVQAMTQQVSIQCCCTSLFLVVHFKLGIKTYGACSVFRLLDMHGGFMWEGYHQQPTNRFFALLVALFLLTFYYII